MLQALFILFALIIGFSCKKVYLREHTLNQILNLSVLFILLIMGYNFGSNSLNLLSESLQLLKIVSAFTLFLFIFNFLAVYAFVQFRKNHLVKAVNNDISQHANFFQYALMSGKYLGLVVVGIILGDLLKWPLSYLNSVVTFILFVVLFIIGFQLRQQGVSMRDILANRTGMLISLIIVISSICAGIFSAYLLGLKSSEGLMLSSGFGWYTLSGILTSKLINHQVGTASFFIDFLREIIAIVLIPLFGRKNPIPFIAYGGATSLDFTLPVIKINLGEEVVPIAITSGMILTVLVPVLIPVMQLI